MSTSINIVEPEIKVYLGKDGEDPDTSGPSLAVSSYSINCAINSVPTAALRLALGDPFFNAGESKVYSSPIKSGDRIWIIARLFSNPARSTELGRVWDTGDSVFLFQGYVSNVSMQTGDGGNGSTLSISVNCVGDMAVLGGLPALSRALINQSSGTTVYDTYRGTFGQTTSATALAIQQLQDAPDRLNKNIGEYTLDVLRALYEAEASDVKKVTGRESYQEALDFLDRVEVIPEMTFADLVNKATNILMSSDASRTLAESWIKSNGLSLLIGFISKYFGVVVYWPAVNKTFIFPYFPLARRAWTEYEPKSVIFVSTGTTLSTRQTVGVRMFGKDLGEDLALQSQDQTTGFFQYPPPEEKVNGQYEYVDMPQWAAIVTLPQVGIPSGGDVKNRENPGAANSATQRESSQDMPKSQYRQFMEMVAKSIYMDKKWSKSGMSVSLNPADFTGQDLGSVVSIKTGENKVFFGYVTAWQFQGTQGTISYSISLSHVRTEEENEEYGFDTHPLYTKYNGINQALNY